MKNKSAEKLEITKNKVNPVGRQEIIPSKSTPRTDPLSTENFQSMRYATYSTQ